MWYIRTDPYISMHKQLSVNVQVHVRAQHSFANPIIVCMSTFGHRQHSHGSALEKSTQRKMRIYPNIFPATKDKRFYKEIIDDFSY